MVHHKAAVTFGLSFRVIYQCCIERESFLQSTIDIVIIVLCKQKKIIVKAKMFCYVNFTVQKYCDFLPFIS